MSASLALAASLLWGTSDFLGGRLSRRLPSTQVIVASQMLATLLLGAFIVGSGAWRADPAYLGWAVAAGLLWVAGVVAFYQALAQGVMGVVAPTASCGVIVPVLGGVLWGERPHIVQLVGILAAGAGVFCCNGPHLTSGGAPRLLRPVLLAGVAALAFGGEILLLARASEHSIPMTLYVMRLTAVNLIGSVALRRRPAQAVTRADAPALLVLGGLDVAAMVAFSLASRGGALSLVAVLASLYPAVTVVLARQFQGERLGPVQILGVVAAVFGAACIAGGGVTA